MKIKHLTTLKHKLQWLLLLTALLGVSQGVWCDNIWNTGCVSLQYQVDGVDQWSDWVDKGGTIDFGTQSNVILRGFKIKVYKPNATYVNGTYNVNGTTGNHNQKSWEDLGGSSATGVCDNEWNVNLVDKWKPSDGQTKTSSIYFTLNGWGGDCETTIYFKFKYSKPCEDTYTIYFDNSATQWANVGVLIGNSSSYSLQKCTRVSGTDVWYYSQTKGCDDETDVYWVNYGGSGASASSSVTTYASGFQDRNITANQISTTGGASNLTGKIFVPTSATGRSAGTTWVTYTASNYTSISGNGRQISTNGYSSDANKYAYIKVKSDLSNANYGENGKKLKAWYWWENSSKDKSKIKDFSYVGYNSSDARYLYKMELGTYFEGLILFNNEQTTGSESFPSCSGNSCRYYCNANLLPYSGNTTCYYDLTATVNSETSMSQFTSFGKPSVSSNISSGSVGTTFTITLGTATNNTFSGDNTYRVYATDGTNLYEICQYKTAAASISWTPTTEGTWTLYSIVTDKYGAERKKSDEITVSVVSCPASYTTNYNVTGGGLYCSSKLAIGLSGSEDGYTYKLYKSGTATAVDTQTGTGSAIAFATQSAAGTYSVKVTAGSSCSEVAVNGGSTSSVTITTGTTPTEANYVLEDNSYTYAPNTPRSVTVKKATGSEAYPTGTIKYAGSDDAPTDANTYAITYNVAATGTYCAATGLSLGNLVIAQASQSAPTVSAISPSVGPGDYTLRATGGTAGYYSYSIVNDGTTGSATILNNGTAEVTLRVTTVGDIYVKAKRLGNSNYAESDYGSATKLTFTKAAQGTAVAVSDMSAANLCGLGLKDLSATGGNGTGYYSYQIVDGGTGTATITDNETASVKLNVTSAGTIKIKAKRLADANYNESSYGDTKTFTFKNAGSLSDFVVTGAEKKYYTGSPISVSVTSDKYSSITVKYNGSTTAPTNPGTYPITITTTATDTHCAVTNLAAGTLTIKVLIRVIDNKDSKWEAVNLYRWNKSDCNSSSWPGEPMEEESSNVWVKELDCIPANLIFNNGGSGGDKQTETEAFVSNKCYEIANVKSGDNWQVNTIECSCSDPTISASPSGTSWSKCANTSEGQRQISVTATGGTGTLTYQWYRNSVASISGAVAVTDMVEGGNTYAPSTSDEGTFYYYCVVRSGGYCSGNSATSGFSGALTILDTPVVQPAAPSVKQYEPVKLTSTNTRVTWGVSPAASETGYLYDQTQKSVMFKGQTGSYTVTATPASGTGCTSTASITVSNDDKECD